jgi:hypothetical protein
MLANKHCAGGRLCSCGRAGMGGPAGHVLRRSGTGCGWVEESDSDGCGGGGGGDGGKIMREEEKRGSSTGQRCLTSHITTGSCVGRWVMGRRSSGCPQHPDPVNGIMSMVDGIQWCEGEGRRMSMTYDEVCAQSQSRARIVQTHVTLEDDCRRVCILLSYFISLLPVWALVWAQFR